MTVAQWGKTHAVDREARSLPGRRGPPPLCGENENGFELLRRQDLALNTLVLVRGCGVADSKTGRAIKKIKIEKNGKMFALSMRLNHNRMGG